MFKQNRKLLLIILSVFLAPLLASSILGYYFIFGPNIPVKQYKQNVVNEINTQMLPIVTRMNNLSNQAGSDLLFLSHLSSIQEVSKNEEDTLSKVDIDLQAFLKDHHEFYQITYLDNLGQELSNVVINNNIVELTPETKLQNRKDEDYFEQTYKLNDDEIYISDIVYLDSPQNIPVIYYATPIVNTKSSEKGVLVIVINADHFLNDIRSFNHPDESVYLVNKDGYYLANPDSSKEFGFTVSNGATFYQDHPNIKNLIHTDYDRGTVEDTNNMYTYCYIYPQLGKFEIYKGWEKLNGSGSEKKNYWILIAVSSKENLANQSGENMKNYLSFIGISSSLFIFLDLFILLFILKTTDYKKLTFFLKKQKGHE